MSLNCSGCSFIGECPHLSIQFNSELGIKRSKSFATSGGVTLSCFPHTKQVGIVISGRSFAILCLIALLARDKILKTYDIEAISSNVDNTVKDEALSALDVLGFSRRQTQRVIDTILRDNPTMNIENLIKQALKKL